VNMTETAQTDLVIEALAVVSGHSIVKPDSALIDELGLDSLDLSAVLVEIEERLGEEIPIEMLIAFGELEERPLRVRHLIEMVQGRAT